MALSDYRGKTDSMNTNRSETEDTSSEISNAGTELNMPPQDNSSDIIEFTAKPNAADSVNVENNHTEIEETITQLSNFHKDTKRSAALEPESHKMMCKQMVLWQNGKKLKSYGLVCCNELKSINAFIKQYVDSMLNFLLWSFLSTLHSELKNLRLVQCSIWLEK